MWREPPCLLQEVLAKVMGEVTGMLSTGLGHRELPPTLGGSPAVRVGLHQERGHVIPEGEAF